MSENRQTRLARAAFCPLTILLAGLLLAGWMSLATAAPDAPGVQIGPDYTQVTAPGRAVLYHHTLTNTGGSSDTFLLEASSARGWPVELLAAGVPEGTAPLPIEVGAQMTAAFQLSLTVPPGTAGLTEVTRITATSQLSPTVKDSAVDTTLVRYVTYALVVLKRWPPVPYPATLNPIDNPDGDGFYTVDWPATTLAQTYSLEEDDDPAFSGPTVVYDGDQTSWPVPVPGKTAGAYYYRVRGHNTWGYGAYSNVAAVSVLPPATPTLNAIDNPDGDGTYTVTWGIAARATGYTLQEDTYADFRSPETVYSGAQTAWPVSGRTPATYYYRIQATGPTGQSGWSDTQTVGVLPFRADDTELTVGECTTLRWYFTGIKALYISFGYGYDKEGAPGIGTREVCPSITTTYEALVVRTDDSQKTHKVKVNVSGSGCGDPVIERFAPTTYHVTPGQPFTIFWDVECANTVRFIGASGVEEPVVGHGSREVSIYTNTTFRLKVEKRSGGFVYASFTVYVS